MATYSEYLMSWVTWPLDLISRPIKEPVIGAFVGWACVWILLHVGSKLMLYSAILFIIFLVSEKFGIITIHTEKLTKYLRSGRGVQDTARNKIPRLLETIQDFLENHWLFSIGLVLGLVVGITF